MIVWRRNQAKSSITTDNVLMHSKIGKKQWIAAVVEEMKTVFIMHTTSKKTDNEFEIMQIFQPSIIWRSRLDSTTAKKWAIKKNKFANPLQQVVNFGRQVLRNFQFY